MKKLFLLLAGGMVVFGANAQYVKHDASIAPTTRKINTMAPNPQSAATAVTLHHNTYKTTKTTTGFYTETFGGGAYSTTPPVNTLPSGWTAGTISGPGTWHWANYPSHAMYSIGAINSTTASDGWMIFDSDSLGGAGTTTISPAGWLQSPLISCTAYSTVRLDFEEYFQEFNGDSCSIWVSTSPTFATYTDYPVAYNDALGGNQATANPYTVHMNISSAAAGQMVYIRFVYYGSPGGDYQWMVDDMDLDTLAAHDVALSGSFLYMPDASAYNSTLLNTPLVMVDSVYPVTQLTDYGADAETNIPVNAQIFQNGTSVYNHTIPYASLPLNSLDSFVQGYPSYFPNAIGNYICAFNATVPADSNAANNNDTAVFTITDTLWSQNQGDINGGYYIHEAGASPVSYFEGVRFDVPSNSPGDTVTGFGVVFDPQSAPTNSGATVSVQLYTVTQSVTTGWAYQATSFARAITAADISSANTAVWAYFGIDSVASGGISAFILQPGTTYAAVVQINNVTTTLVIDATSAPNATGPCGYFGQSDTSNDDGNETFGGTLATGITSGIPLVSMYLGHLPHSSGIGNVNANINTVNAYPNPAANELNVSYSVANTSNVSVSLTDVLGQTVATQNMGNVTNGKAVFNTAALPDGMYIYTLQANGARTTGHVVIAH